MFDQNGYKFKENPIDIANTEKCLRDNPFEILGKSITKLLVSFSNITYTHNSPLTKTKSYLTCKHNCVTFCVDSVLFHDADFILIS